MHTQAKNAPEHRTGTASTFPAAAGLGLYLLTLSVEVLLGASSRWLLTYLGAATIGTLVPLGLSAEALAWASALAPLAWSALGLLWPGQERLWRRRVGARRPSAEEAAALADAFTMLEACGGPPPVVAWVLDTPLPAAAMRGRTLILSHALFESDSLPAVLAHELGHADSLDGRLTEALARLTICEDPLAPPTDASGGEAAADDEAGGVLWNTLRWTLRLACGGTGQRLLTPLWAGHWRAREYAADAYAASLGQGEDLARHLADYEQALDFARPSLPFNRSQHPPVAHRIERLRDVSFAAVSE